MNCMNPCLQTRGSSQFNIWTDENASTRMFDTLMFANEINVMAT